jgi:hypothetical protein
MSTSSESTVTIMSDQKTLSFDEIVKIFEVNREKIPEFLKTHGSYEKLKQLFIDLENKNYFPDETVFNITNFDKERKYTFYELITDETCNCFLNLFHFLKIDKVLEVGAGCGLLTKRLTDFSEHKIIIEASDSHRQEFNPCTLASYTDIKTESFEMIKSKDSILISWLHENYQNEFLNMIERNKPNYVFHLGEADGACYTPDLPKRMETMGYKMLIIPALCIAHMDYFTYDHLRPKDKPSTRSAITFFYLDHLKQDEILNACGKENLGLYMPCTEMYALQDMGSYSQKKREKQSAHFKSSLGLSSSLNYGDDLNNSMMMIKLMMLSEMLKGYGNIGSLSSMLNQEQMEGRTYRSSDSSKEETANNEHKKK